MPPADNTKFLLEATRQRSTRARSDAEQAIRDAQRTRDPITAADIARAAGVSRSWLYTQSDLIAAIEALRQDAPSPIRTGRQPATSDSLKTRLDAALARIKGLRADNADLSRRLETAHGEIRRLRVACVPAPRTSIENVDAPDRQGPRRKQD